MLHTFTILLPQTALAVFACVFFLGGSFPVPARRWGPLALLALIVTAACLVYSSGQKNPMDAGLHTFFNQEATPRPSQMATVIADSYVEVQRSGVWNDDLSIGFQWFTLALGALFVLMSHAEQAESRTAAEFYGMLLLIIAGMMLVSAANDLILLFLALELISVPTYVLLYLGRRDYASQEAATKYFLLSVLSAAVLLYGFSFLYGLTGTTHLGAIRAVLEGTYQAAKPGLPPAGGSTLGLVALVLIFAGLGFKIAAVPFHFYAPDVYQGTSAFNAGLLAVVPKAAGFIALIRVGSETMVGFETSGERVAMILAAITMTGGNCLALLQTNVRRLLAYSSIAHAGYMLIAIAVGFWDTWNVPQSLDAGGALPGGVRACLFYLFGYCLASAGLFAVLVYLAGPRGKQVEHIEDLTGLVRTQPVMAIAAAIFLFSMTGIPPLLGFWGKLTVFAGALSVRVQVTADALPQMHFGFAVLAILGVLNAAVAAVYYLRIVGIMFLSDPLSTPRPTGGRPAFVSACCAAVVVLALGLFPGPVFNSLEEMKMPAVSSATPRVPGGHNRVERRGGDGAAISAAASL